MKVGLLLHWQPKPEGTKYGRMFSFLVSWKYQRGCLGVLTKKTACLISVQTRPEEQYRSLCSGEAICHPKDTFNKPFARRLTLGKALQKTVPALKEMTGLDFFEFADAKKLKKVRQSFWDAYFTQVKDKCGKVTRFLPADAASRKT